MDNLKTYMVTLEQRNITVRTANVNVKAETAEDAKVLARYQQLHSWDWNAQEENQCASIIAAVSEVTNEPEVVDSAPVADVAPVSADDPDIPF